MLIDEFVFKTHFWCFLNFLRFSKYVNIRLEVIQKKEELFALPLKKICYLNLNPL